MAVNLFVARNKVEVNKYIHKKKLRSHINRSIQSTADILGHAKTCKLYILEGATSRKELPSILYYAENTGMKITYDDTDYWENL